MIGGAAELGKTTLATHYLTDCVIGDAAEMCKTTLATPYLLNRLCDRWCRRNSSNYISNPLHADQECARVETS